MEQADVGEAIAARLGVPLLDKTRLADQLGIPERTLDQWAYRGVGPKYLRVGRHRRYRPADVEAWLVTQEHGGAAA